MKGLWQNPAGVEAQCICKEHEVSKVGGGAYEPDEPGGEVDVAPGASVDEDDDDPVPAEHCRTLES